MKKLFGLLLVLGTTFLVTHAQNKEAEIKHLRDEINLSKSTPIVINKDADFPARSTIKIFPAIKHGKTFAKAFVQWVNDWNKNNSNQFGRLEIVDKIEDADVVAAQFRYGVQTYVSEARVRASTGKISTNDDDFIGQGVGNSKVRVETGHEAVEFPLYSYLLVRGTNDSWVLDFSFVEKYLDKNENFTDRRLQGIIERKMREK